MRGNPVAQGQNRTGFSVAKTGGNNKEGPRNMKNGELTPYGSGIPLDFPWERKMKNAEF